MGPWPVLGLLFGGDSGRARSGALPVPERDDTKVGAKERSPARHRETCGGKDEAGKIHSLSGTFWSGAMRPDTIGGKDADFTLLFRSRKAAGGMETASVPEIVGELFVGLYCEMENSMTAAKACRNTSTVRHERSAGISNDRDFHRSFSMISFCFSVVCPASRSMRCRSAAFCAFNCRIASFRSLTSVCRSASAFRFSADVFGTFGDRFGKGLRIAWMIRVPLPGCDDG